MTRLIEKRLKGDWVFRDEDACKKLPALAARLGVKPKQKDSPASIVFYCSTTDEDYDVFDLVNALLDKLEKGVLK